MSIVVEFALLHWGVEAGRIAVVSFQIPGVLYLERPRGAEVPLLLDSPHSGSQYPEDFGTRVPLPVLRRAEDCHVDALFAGATAFGATLLAALFPRSYIDPNRAETDLDPALLADGWPGRIKTSDKAKLGHGLIWRICPPDYAMYDRLLSVEEVRHRIEDYWRPYHAMLRGRLEDLHQRFGCVYHLNCHSMPASSTPARAVRNTLRRADFVLGDRDGQSCDGEFRDVVRTCLEEMGYQVRINDPYRGVELVRAYSDPFRARHSLQIEINRGLYMNEVTLEPLDGYWTLRRDLDRMVERVAEFVRITARRQAAAD